MSALEPAARGLATSAWLVVASAAVVMVLGLLHLLYTFHGSKLLPRDPAVRVAMAGDSPRISRQTTMWRAWIGFNASHSLGAILFALVYGYLAWQQPQLLFGSVFLCALGQAFLLAYVGLGVRYWFSVPLGGVLLAALLFLAAWVLAR